MSITARLRSLFYIYLIPSLSGSGMQLYTAVSYDYQAVGGHVKGCS